MHEHHRGAGFEGEHRRRKQGHGHHSHKDDGFGRGGRARRGEARFVLLDVLRIGPKHGYEIIKTLEERSSGQYIPSPGTVYPTLQYLEDLGFVTVIQEAERRIYRLTEKGEAELKARAEEINAFWARFQQTENSLANQTEINFLQEELQFLEQTVWRVVRDVASPTNQETIRRIRSAVEQCRNEVRRIATEPQSSEKSRAIEEKE
jgi:DNA-binding PadR family transcriptional regulator